MEQNLSAINRSAVYSRDPRRITSLRGILVTMSSEDLDTRLELWNRNYSQTLGIIMTDPTYTQDEIVDLLDSQEDEGGASLG